MSINSIIVCGGDVVTQMSLFDPDGRRGVPRNATGRSTRRTLLVTVKAAPQPSTNHGETVCVGALSLDPGQPGWVRLYPISYRFLDGPHQFHKYDVIEVDVVPARQDSRRESWQPRMDSLVIGKNLASWRQRRSWIDPYLDEYSMCELIRDAREDPTSRSIGLIRAAEIDDVIVTRHPGWTPEEQRKIDNYARQPFLFGEQDPVPLEAPRFRVQYSYRCRDKRCPRHLQTLVDWEVVALQRRLYGDDDRVRQELLGHCRGLVSRPERITAFYVGNQAGRRRTFSIGGVYYPPE
jgi:hypothetical protein